MRWVDVIALPFLLQNHQILWLQYMNESGTVNIVLCVRAAVGLQCAAFVYCPSCVWCLSCTTAAVSLGFLQWNNNRVCVHCTTQNRFHFNGSHIMSLESTLFRVMGNLLLKWFSHCCTLRWFPHVAVSCGVVPLEHWNLILAPANASSSRNSMWPL